MSDVPQISCWRFACAEADVLADAPGTCGTGMSANVLTVCNANALANGGANVLAIGGENVPTVCDMDMPAAGCDDVPSSAG